MALTDKQRRFVDEYLIDLNASQAAIRAGYRGKSNVQGAQNLSKPNIAIAIQIAMQERGQRTAITADNVIREIERLAMFDPADLTDIKCPEDIKKAPNDVRRAITGWKWDKQGNFIITMAKQGALEMLGRHHKLFTDKVEAKVEGSVIIQASPLDEHI